VATKKREKITPEIKRNAPHLPERCIGSPAVNGKAHSLYPATLPASLVVTGITLQNDYSNLHLPGPRICPILWRGAWPVCICLSEGLLESQAAANPSCPSPGMRRVSHTAFCPIGGRLLFYLLQGHLPVNGIPYYEIFF
jgi:hypothetical protein